MYCANCGKEIMVFLDEEWEYCPKCKLYTKGATEKRPKRNVSGTSLDYLNFQALGLMLSLLYMVITEGVVFCFEDFSAIIGALLLFIVPCCMSLFFLVQEWYRYLGSFHFCMCVTYQILINAPYIFLGIKLINAFLL